MPLYRVEANGDLTPFLLGVIVEDGVDFGAGPVGTSVAQVRLYTASLLGDLAEAPAVGVRVHKAALLATQIDIRVSLHTASLLGVPPSVRTSLHEALLIGVPV